MNRIHTCPRMPRGPLKLNSPTRMPEEVVSHLVTQELDLLPDNKRVREGNVSENSGAYAQARKRLPLEFIVQVSEAICNRLGEMSPGVLDGRRAFILDGTTI